MKKILILICVAVFTLLILSACIMNEKIFATSENFEETFQISKIFENQSAENVDCVKNPSTPILHISNEFFELATGENGKLYEVGGSSIENYQVWGENDAPGLYCNDYSVSSYNITVILYILGERIYADTGRGTPFWVELNEHYGKEKVDDVMILGYNYFVETRNDFFRSAPMSEEIQLPPLYRLIQYYEISEEVFMAYHADKSDWWSPRSPEFLRLMFLPEKEMKIALLNKKGAIFNETVYNIFTLNELFQNNLEAFAQIDLQDLVQFQENLESTGIYRGFNEDMVEFANTNNVNSDVTDFLATR